MAIKKYNGQRGECKVMYANDTSHANQKAPHSHIEIRTNYRAIAHLFVDKIKNVKQNRIHANSRFRTTPTRRSKF